MSKNFIILLLILFKASTSYGQVSIINATSKSIDIKDGKKIKKGYWTLDSTAKPDVYKTTAEESKTVIFYTDIDSISFEVEAEKKYDFVILLNDKDSCWTQINTIDSKLKIDYAPYRIDTNNTIILKVLNAYKAYFLNKPKRPSETKNWNKTEKANLGLYDFSHQHLFMNILTDDEDDYTLKIMSIEPIEGTEKYEIKAALLYTGDGKNPFGTIILIHKLTACFEDRKVVFENNFVEMTKNWKKTKYKNLTYTHHPNYKLDLLLAEKANLFIDSICTLLKVDTLNKQIDYTLVRNFDEFANLLGFDYFSYEFTSGIASTHESYIKTMKGPFHAHELVHLVSHFMADFILYEGIANFLGTKLVEEKRYYKTMSDLKRYMEYSDYSIKDFFEKPYQNYYKNPFGAFLCEYIYTEYGMDKLIYLLKLNTIKECALLEGIVLTTNKSEKEFLENFEVFIANFNTER